MTTTAKSSRSLLIIEDDADLRLTLEYFLGKIGYKVLTSRDADEGIRLCLEHRPRAVLLDIMLPGSDGFECCKRIKGDPITMDTKVVFITGKKASEVHIKGAKACADFWIPKPVDPNDVGADLYFLFERDFDLTPEDFKQLRVTKQVPRLTGTSQTAYQQAGVEHPPVHFQTHRGHDHVEYPYAKAPHPPHETHSHEAVDHDRQGSVSDYEFEEPKFQTYSASQAPPAASASSGAEMAKVYALLRALRDSLKDTSARLDAVIQYIDMLDK